LFFGESRGVLADHFVSIMRCPVSKSPVIYFPRGEADTTEADAFIVCPASRLRYRIDEGVPVFLAEEATELAPAEIDRLVARARQLGLSTSHLGQP
jgi:uncharacterized protein YbaR (Trm112 family)